MSEFPEEFVGMTEAEFAEWFSKRHEKAERSAKKKRITRAVKEALQADGWDG